MLPSASYTPVFFPLSLLTGAIKNPSNNPISPGNQRDRNQGDTSTSITAGAPHVQGHRVTSDERSLTSPHPPRPSPRLGRPRPCEGRGSRAITPATPSSGPLGPAHFRPRRCTEPPGDQELASGRAVWGRDPGRRAAECGGRAP